MASTLGLGLMSLSHLSFAQQDYYKWVDSNGSTHYSTTPPPKAKGVKTRGKIKTYGWSTTPVQNTTSQKEGVSEQQTTPATSQTQANSTQQQPNNSQQVKNTGSVQPQNNQQKMQPVAAPIGR